MDPHESRGKEKFKSYPDDIQAVMDQLRNHILQVATEHDLGSVEESLKWGEPSYVVKGGSAVRIDWKEKSPDKYFVYFLCQTRLVETCKELYGKLFVYEGKRAIVFDLADDLPIQELKHCISLSLRYHSVKQLPLLRA
jgi:hypothetical protein